MSTIPSPHHTLPVCRLPLGFKIPLQRLDWLRKTISAHADVQDDRLHNHAVRTRVLYRYPLVQYKSIDGMAELMGIGAEGCESLQGLMDDPGFVQHFRQDGMLSAEVETQALELYQNQWVKYGLHHWVGLNDDNFRLWSTEKSMVKRTQLLENCLTGHILKFCSAIGWLLPPKALQVELHDARLTREAPYLHGNHFKGAFQVYFAANITLPPDIGLGKGVAFGLGRLSRAAEPSPST